MSKNNSTDFIENLYDIAEADFPEAETAPLVLRSNKLDNILDKLPNEIIYLGAYFTSSLHKKMGGDVESYQAISDTFNYEMEGLIVMHKKGAMIATKAARLSLQKIFRAASRVNGARNDLLSSFGSLKKVGASFPDANPFPTTMDVDIVATHISIQEFIVFARKMLQGFILSQENMQDYDKNTVLSSTEGLSIKSVVENYSHFIANIADASPVIISERARISDQLLADLSKYSVHDPKEQARILYGVFQALAEVFVVVDGILIEDIASMLNMANLQEYKVEISRAVNTYNPKQTMTPAQIKDLLKLAERAREIEQKIKYVVASNKRLK